MGSAEAPLPPTAQPPGPEQHGSNGAGAGSSTDTGEVASGRLSFCAMQAAFITFASDDRSKVVMWFVSHAVSLRSHDVLYPFPSGLDSIGMKASVFFQFTSVAELTADDAVNHFATKWLTAS